MTPIEVLVQSVERKFKGNEFDKFIHEVTFPKFKSFAPDVKIEFKFPIAVVVGPNGGGKSSLLHAAWGMPHKHSTSRFWFSTPVDPIDFDEKDQPRYWYSHYAKSINQRLESRKMCGRKRHGYWEPTRPAQKEGMKSMPDQNPALSPYMSRTGDRWTPVERTSYYFNAKTESSAFDRFFNSASLTSLDARQDYFVKYSKKLKEVIDGKLTHLPYYKIERVSENRLLSQAQLDNVNKILQKNYKSARYISHKFYDKSAFSPSVIFETDARSYSECFAGSGELAVVNYVLALEGLKKFDLLLLDEPETSLHPGAQNKLIEHLLRIVDEKQIQVIISTHSPTFVELLPASALVVLEESEAGIAPRPFPTKASAFDRLGVVDKTKITILAEDKLLEAFVSRALLSLPRTLRDTATVVAAEVGVSEMLAHQARAHLQARSNVIMVLDGDQAPVQAIFEQDPSDMNAKQKKEAIAQLHNLNVSIVGSNEDLEGWMAWCKKHVVLIDKVCAEQIFLELEAPSHPLFSNPAATNSQFKGAVRSALRHSGNTAEDQYRVFRYLLNKVPDGSPVHQSLAELASKIRLKLEQLLRDATG
jgi:predicted ATPase